MNRIFDLGYFLSRNLGPVCLGIFVTLAVLELVLAPRPPAGAASPRRALVNFGMQILIILLATLVPLGVVSAALLAERWQIGLFHQLAAPAPLILLAALLSQTLISYGMHRLSHKLPLLWRLHRCHHSDPHVDLSLALRHHPLEMLPVGVVATAATLAMGLPVWAVAIVQLLMIIASYCEHIAIRLPDGATRLIGPLIATPAFHHIHHSADQPQTDSNFGSLLSIWDRLFGTYRDPLTTVVARIGLGDADDRAADNLLAQLLMPFAPAAPSSPPGTEHRS